jgi:hypothetical protein
MGAVMRVRVFAAILVAFFVVPAWAEEFAQITPMSKGSVVAGADPIKVLSDSYYQDSYEMFGDTLKQMLAPIQPPILNETDWFLIVFAATPSNAKDPILVMTLYHAGLKHPVATLPGVGAFKEIFLSDREHAELGRVYVVTQDTDPLHADIIKFAQQVSLGGIAGKLSKVNTIMGVTSAPLHAPTPRTPTLFYAISDVTVPFKHATVIGKAAAIPPDLSVTKLMEKAGELQKQLLNRKARISECAMKLASDLTGVVNTMVPADPVTQKQRTDLSDDLDTQTTTTLASVTCTDENQPGTPERAAKNAAVTEVQEAFQALAAGSDRKRIEGDATLHNVPPRLLSFGAIAGGMFAIHGDRAKVSNDKIAADPLNGTITLAAVNISMRRFDPTTVNATAAEKFRAFVGYVVTPEPGIGAGLSYLFFRGLSINAGAAQMLIMTTKGDDDIGKPVTEAQPLKHGWGRAFFLGLGYNF